MDLKAFGVTIGEGKHHEEIIYSMALLYNAISTEIGAFLKDYDLTIGKLNILLAIKHHGGDIGIRQVDISNHLIVTPSNMTKMIDKLERIKLVSRHSLKGDRRANVIRITEKGVKLLDSVWVEYNNKLIGAVDPLNKKEQKKLANVLVNWIGRVNS